MTDNNINLETTTRLDRLVRPSLDSLAAGNPADIAQAIGNQWRNMSLEKKDLFLKAGIGHAASRGPRSEFSALTNQIVAQRV